MEFQKLGKRTRRQVVRTPGTFVMEKEADTNVYILKQCLTFWLGNECQYQIPMLVLFLTLSKKNFFEKHPRCKYALLVGFTREWAQGIENE